MLLRCGRGDLALTSWHSLLFCAQADVTIERITSLAATTGTEPLTLDFKQKAPPRVAECVASMANSHGGLILVGITDIDRKVVGVKTEAAGISGTVDLMLKTGLGVAPGPACRGRPLSEEAISELAAALDKSPLTQALLTLAAQTSGELSRFCGFGRRGRPNNSGTATLVWAIAYATLGP